MTLILVSEFGKVKPGKDLQECRQTEAERKTLKINGLTLTPPLPYGITAGGRDPWWNGMGKSVGPRIEAARKTSELRSDAQGGALCHRIR